MILNRGGTRRAGVILVGLIIGLGVIGCQGKGPSVKLAGPEEGRRWAYMVVSNKQDKALLLWYDSETEYRGSILDLEDGSERVIPGVVERGGWLGAWSPDDKFLAGTWESKEGKEGGKGTGTQLSIMNTETLEIRDLPLPKAIKIPSYPSWSSDGKSLIFQGIVDEIPPNAGRVTYIYYFEYEKCVPFAIGKTYRCNRALWDHRVIFSQDCWRTGEERAFYSVATSTDPWIQIYPQREINYISISPSNRRGILHCPQSEQAGGAGTYWEVLDLILLEGPTEQEGKLICSVVAELGALHPIWSQDEKKILFDEPSDTGREAIWHMWIVDLEDGRKEILSDKEGKPMEGMNASFVNGDEGVVFRNGNGVFIYNLATKKVTRLFSFKEI